MKSGNRRALTWLLSGAAFVTAIVASGCSSRDACSVSCARFVPPPATLPTDASPSQPGFELVGIESPTPPRINVFGEFNGVQRQPPKRIGEAGFQQHTFLDEGYDGDVAVDPKGQWLVFSSTRHSENADIYLQRVDGVSVTQLTSDDAADANPVFSPDGSRIAFCSTRAGNWDIFVMDIDGRNITQVTSSPMQEIHPSFSPDGARLVYSAMSPRSQQWELWTVNLLTNERRMIGFGLFPTWSPAKDKDQIAFQKARARGSRWFSLWTLELVDGEARRVTEVAVSSNAAIVSPSWSPDGKRLSFATIVEPAKGQTGQQDIWTVSSDGTNRHRITDGTGLCATPFWGADNRVYFVSNRGGADCIWSAKVDQTNTATATVDTK
jgi:Tol biopolymer transport system component